MKTIEVVYSPPTDRPWIMRRTVSAIGAAMPSTCVAGQDADQEGRDRHRRHREGERGAAAELVADMTDHRAAHGPHQEADGEDAEGRQDLGDGSPLGKKARPMAAAK